MLFVTISLLRSEVALKIFSQILIKYREIYRKKFLQNRENWKKNSIDFPQYAEQYA